MSVAYLFCPSRQAKRLSLSALRPVKLFLPTFLLLLLLAGSAFAEGLAATFRSDYADKRYDFDITHAQINAMPAWPDSTENPPLSPRKAFALASGELTILLPNVKVWYGPQITLHGLGTGAFYVVKFIIPLHPEQMDAPVVEMRIPVLMDGTVIKPRVGPAAYP